MLQTHCVKYRINTFWCQLCSYNQALLYFIIYDAHVVVYSGIPRCIQWLTISIADKLIQTRQRLRRRSDVHGRKEKMNRRRLLLHLPGRDLLSSAADTTASQELWTRILTSVGLSSCEPTVPSVDGSYRSQQLNQLLWRELRWSAQLPHSGCSSLCRRRPQFIQLQYMDSHAIQYRLLVGEIFHVQAYDHLLTVLSSMITR